MELGQAELQKTEADIADTDAQYQYRLTRLVVAYTIGAPKYAAPRLGTLRDTSEKTDDDTRHSQGSRRRVRPAAPLHATDRPWAVVVVKTKHSTVNSGASASFPVTIHVTGYSHSIDVPVRRCLYVYLREGSQTHRYLHT